ncbi:MAG: ABC transporter permease [Pirellulaceae bacterium]
MYIVLLAWRYLRTRFIAVASIVSVTLGVATLIVVNAVMAGFVDQMHQRLHGILSDIEIAPPGMGEIYDVDWCVDQIHQLAGDDLEAITTVVRVPAMLQFTFGGRPMTHTVMLIGIDDETFGTVTDFKPYLTNALNREDPSFELRSEGYDPEIGECGWGYRRRIAELDRQYHEQIRQYQRERQQTVPTPISQPHQSTHDNQSQVQSLPPLPTETPILPSEGVDERQTAAQQGLRYVDPSEAYRDPISPEDIFDASRDQYIGIIIGKGIAYRNIPESDRGPAQELYLLRPGDDVHVTLPTAGDNPAPIMENCTIVDFYSSNMHEYDSSFAFMPLSHLQKIRGMVDPWRGTASVSAIQIKMKPDADLERMRDKLIAFFPPDMPYVIQTWQDTQRPLLNAVNLELTILNILLFLIIGVAGFGILATFFMIVVEKTRDIGILKSLGAPGRGVMSIFLGYGLSLGTVGTGVGILLGLIFVWNINGIANVIQTITGTKVYDPMIYFFDEIPTIVSPWMVCWVALGAILIAVMASVLPAIRAARLHPVEALRYE